ncbi:MAG: glycosyltransferase [Bacteroidota bacterium]
MSDLPELSIIVCTYNRDQYIDKTLNYLFQQDLDPSEYEVIIVDNNSTDQTAQICQNFLESNSTAPFYYFLETNQGHSYSRNRGVKESNAKLISFIDDDAFVHPSFGKNIIRFFQEYEDCLVIGGKIIPVYEEEEPKWMSRFLLPLVSALDMGNSPRPFTGRKFPVGANMAFRRTVFDRYGLFNVALGRKGSGLLGGDEKELIYRVKADNLPIYYVPDVVVDHIIPPKRLIKTYIQGLAQGVGLSEKERLSHASFPQKLQRGLEELIKIGGTLILFIWYLLRGQLAKGIMLIKFRIWVLQGFLH